VWLFLYLHELDIIRPEKTSFEELHLHRVAEEINIIRIQDLWWDPNATQWRESLGPSTDSYRVRGRFNHTVVTSYFRIKSKHSRNKYNRWMRNILSMQDAMVMFATSEEVERIKKLRKNVPGKTVVVTMQLNQTRMLTYYNRTFWEIQHSTDPESAFHNENLYVIRNEKIEFLKKTVKVNPFMSDFFAWIDFGYVRNTRHNG